MPLELASGILDELVVPGRRLIFCDDTDLEGRPVAMLEPDLRILVAVELDSGAYASAALQMAAYLDNLGMPEFHATEIANPGSKSPWKAIDTDRRIEALEWLGDLLAGLEASVSFARIPKAQFNELKAQAQQLGSVGVGFKQGLRRVFLRCLFEECEQYAAPTLIVLDQEGPVAEPTVEHWLAGTFLVGGGPIVARSSDVAGLQLADLAAWSVGRYVRHRERFRGTKATPFDQIALTVVGRLDGLRDLIATATTRESMADAVA